ncbi:MAG: twin-arginine translocase TatA/TatE family subunit [Ignavibacteria bacterium]|nr:twin-arginine translocase TatA/TatE family subunit [Ignavibacteria bacterium]
MFGNLFEGPHLLIILLAIIVLFGSKKVPEFMQGLGKGIKEFKKAAKDIQDSVDDIGEKKKN